jgi:hypothetical protein
MRWRLALAAPGAAAPVAAPRGGDPAPDPAVVAVAVCAFLPGAGDRSAIILALGLGSS